VTEFSPEEQKQIDDKWAELEKGFHDAKVHSICLKVLTIILADDGVTWRQQWNRQMADAFWIHLDATYEDKSHKKACEDLIYFASYVHHQLDRMELAAGILVILDEAVIKYKLVNLDVNGKFEAALDERNNAVTGGKSRPVPALTGADRPAGAVRPDQLGGNKRRI